MKSTHQNPCGNNHTPTEWATYHLASNRVATNSFAPAIAPAPGSVQMDADGRLLYDGSKSYLWEAQGTLCGVTTAAGSHYQYFYDAEGRRVTTTSRPDANCAFGTTTLSDYILDQAGRQITELDGNGHWKHTNIYANGELLATYDPAGTHFALSDWLGDKRVQASAAGTAQLSCWNFPFNDDFGCTGTDATEHRYTGKEHDPLTGIDLFGAREFTGYSGRFLSPDWSSKPEDVPYADLENPQSLNLYSYVNNNPLSRTDPDGHCTNGGEQKGFWWCAFNDSDQDAARARQQLAQFKNISINGKTPADAAKGLSNTQTVNLERSVFNYISSQAMSTPGMMLGLAIVPGGMEELVPAEAAVAAEGVEAVGTGGEATAESAQMNRLSAGEIKKLQNNGIDPHDLKPNSKFDLFKNKNGDVFVKPKAGNGPGEPTGINLKELQ